MKMKLSDDLSLRDIFFSEEYQDCIDYYKDKVKNNSEDLERQDIFNAEGVFLSSRTRSLVFFELVLK